MPAASNGALKRAEEHPLNSPKKIGGRKDDYKCGGAAHPWGEKRRTEGAKKHYHFCHEAAKAGQAGGGKEGNQDEARETFHPRGQPGIVSDGSVACPIIDYADCQK